MSLPVNHQVPDRCPGALRPFVSGDGSMVRVRRPGGRVRVHELVELLEVTRRHSGAELIQLTSRGNLQLRALPDPLPEDLVNDLHDWLPFPDHELVRNLLASPLDDAAQTMIADVDTRLCADPDLAGLPGRFLAVIDTCGDVIGEPFDLAWAADRTDPTVGWLHLGGHGLARRVRAEDAAETLVHVARVFQGFRTQAAERGHAAPWHVREVDPAVFGVDWEARPTPSGTPLPCGPLDGGQVVAGVPLGFLTASLIQVLHGLGGNTEVTVTPWRQLVMPEHPGLGEAGFIIDAADPWASISACVGAPSCRRTDADTIGHAQRLAETGVDESVHVAGCDRRCGAPRDARVEVLA